MPKPGLLDWYCERWEHSNQGIDAHAEPTQMSLTLPLTSQQARHLHFIVCIHLFVPHLEILFFLFIQDSFMLLHLLTICFSLFLSTILQSRGTTLIEQLLCSLLNNCCVLEHKYLYFGAVSSESVTQIRYSFWACPKFCAKIIL